MAVPVHVTRAGLPGDAILSTRHHGGPDQALDIYGGADTAWWATGLGQAVAPGTFGENLTVSFLQVVSNAPNPPTKRACSAQALKAG